MPETARLTEKAQDNLEQIKEKHDLNLNTSSVVEAALVSYNDKIEE